MPQQKSKTTWQQDLYFALQTLILAAISVVLVFMFIGRINIVDGESMEPTLHDRELIVVRSLGYRPQPGDVVVLHKNFDDVTSPVVKRVVAVGGQTVDIDYASNTVTVDGIPVDEPYLLEQMEDLSIYLPITHLEVPEGSVFVMGDNRNGSSDSRNPALGAVDERYILGEAMLVFFPFSNFRAV